MRVVINGVKSLTGKGGHLDLMDEDGAVVATVPWASDFELQQETDEDDELGLSLRVDDIDAVIEMENDEHDWTIWWSMMR